MLFLKQAPAVLRLFYNNLIWILASLSLDIVFMILVNLVFFKAYSTVILNIEEIQTLMTESMSGISEDIGKGLTTELIKNQDLILGYYKEIMFWVVVFVVAGFLAWVATQSLTWFIAHRINKTKASFLKFLGLFFLASLIGLLIIAGSLFLTTSLISYSTGMKVQIVDVKLIAYLPLIVFFILSYFVLAAYSSIALQHPVRAFKTAIERFSETAPMFLLAMLFIALIDFGLILLARFNPALALIGIAVILLPYLALMRIYFCRVVKELAD